jgi:hypothetical protein
MKRVYAALALLVLAPFGAAQAQACLGLNPHTLAPMNLTVGAQFTDGAKFYDARFGFGSSIAFGGIRGGLIDGDNTDGTAKLIGVDGGLSFITGQSRNVVVCPIVSLDYTTFPDLGLSGYDASSTDGGIGLAVGATMNTGTLRLIPFGSVKLVYSRLDVDTPLGDDSDSETFGELAGGLSFAFSDQLLIRPMILVPLGLEGADPRFGVALSLGFGSR